MNLVSGVGDPVVVAGEGPLLVARGREMDLLGCLSGSIVLHDNSPVQAWRNSPAGIWVEFVSFQYRETSDRQRERKVYVS